jgi:hypothetical protein
MCFIRRVKITSDMKRRPLELARRAATLGALALAVGGCSWMPKGRVPLDAAAGFYETAGLTYRVDAAAIGQPMDVLRVERQQCSYEQVASSPLANETTGTLTVTYPHPCGKNGLAQAQFSLANAPQKAASPRPTWNPFKKKKSEAIQSILATGNDMQESWVLDIPAAESDQLFKMLANQGFYQTERPSAAGVQLTAKINGKELTKNWEQVPQLNALIQRVRRDGQLVAYHRADAAAGKPAQQITSTRAYSEMLANIGGATPGAAATSVAATNPFSMPAPQPAVVQAQAVVPVASLPAETR